MGGRLSSMIQSWPNLAAGSASVYQQHLQYNLIVRREISMLRVECCGAAWISPVHGLRHKPIATIVSPMALILAQ